MRRRLPSPALVIASIALFAALAGAGFAASSALVKSPQPIALVPGSVSAAGKVTGPHLTGARVSQGVYTLTISGNTFRSGASTAAVRSLITPQVITIQGSNKVINPTCSISRKPTRVSSNGGNGIEVRASCFAFDPATGWQPTDAAFDVQISGPN